MNQQLNHQPTTHNPSHAIQPHRFAFSWPYRFGLMALTLIGLLLVNPWVFDTSVANAMSTTNDELNHSGVGVFEVAAQQLVRPTPTPTPTDTSADKVTTTDKTVKPDDTVKADDAVKPNDTVKAGNILVLGAVASSNTTSAGSATGGSGTTSGIGGVSVLGTTSGIGAGSASNAVSAPVEEAVAVQTPTDTSSEPIAPTNP